LIVDIEDSLEVEKLIRRLGGTIKIGEIKFQVSDLKYQKLVELIEVKIVKVNLILVFHIMERIN